MSVRISKLGGKIIVATDYMEQVESVNCGVWFGVGARHESSDLNGAAHFLEHMAFKGTPSRSARQIAQEIEKLGGHLNAWTSRECTAYYAKTLGKDVGTSLDILSDILQNHSLRKEEMERERQVIIQEIGMVNDTPDDLVFDYFQGQAFPQQALGRSILGDIERISSMSREDLLRFTERNYSSERMVIAASGKFDHDYFVSKIEEVFSVFRHQGAPSEEKMNYVGGSSYKVKPLDQAHIVFGLSCGGYLDKDYYALRLYSIILGGGMASRLFQKVREERGLAYSVHAFYIPYIDGGIIGFYAGTSGNKVEELLRVSYGEARDITHNLSSEELQRAKSILKSSYLMSLESTSARSNRLAKQLLTYGKHYTVSELMELIDRVEGSDIKKLGDKIFSKAATLSALGPLEKGFMDKDLRVLMQ